MTAGLWPFGALDSSTRRERGSPRLRGAPLPHEERRVERYHHTAAETLGLHRPGLAVVAELLLRGPQSRGNLRGRASRMEEIASLEVLGQLLATLKEKDYVAECPPAADSRAARIAQLLSPDSHPVDTIVITPTQGAHAPAPPPAGESARMQKLEDAVGLLRRQLENLAAKLGEALEG